MSIGDDLVVEVRAGACVRDVRVFAESRGRPLAEAWCGDVRLDDDHPAGVWPLLTGARLTESPGAACAPPRGPHLTAIAGPDAGARVAGGRERVLVGRGHAADVRVRDPRMSARHLQIDPEPGVNVRDAGSRNGTHIVRPTGRRWLRRGLVLEPGDEVQCGRTTFAFTTAPGARTNTAPTSPTAQAAQAGSPSDAPAPAGRIAGLAASAGGGVALAAATGRWWLALVGLVYPATAIAPEIARRFRERSARARAPRSRPIATTSPLADGSGRWNGNVHVGGEPIAAEAYARAVVVGRERQPPAGSWTEPWMSWLPPAAPGDGVVLVDGEAPSWVDVRAHVTAEAAVVTDAAGASVAALALVHHHTAEARAREVAARQSQSGPPPASTWADVSDRGPASRPGLRVPLGSGVGARDFVLDFDAQGPHVLVAGTTGSGKSGLLETLVLSAAARYSPADLAIALVDFKGGAGLAACTGLPHIAGLLTDLEPHLASRALVSLGAELHARKEALAAAGHSSFDAWEAEGGCPARMLVVIDEYQDLAAASPNFLPHVVRIAAQGRSLGLHLVLATQRPAGAVTPEIRANVATTIALRCASDSESRDLIGTGEAAAIPADEPGHAIVATGSSRETMRTARASALPTPPVRDIEEAAPAHEPATLAALARQGNAAPPLWLPPLPATVTWEEAAGTAGPDISGLVIGFADDPVARTQTAIAWAPARGALAVVGPRGSGRSTAMRAIATAAAGAGRAYAWLPSDPRLAMRTLERAADEPSLVVLVDNLDQTVDALDGHTRGAGVDLLRARLDRLPTAIACGPQTPTRLLATCTSRLVLGALDSVDASAWSVPRELAALPDTPGRGRWLAGTQWLEAQVALTTDAADGARVLAVPLPVVATRPSAQGGVANDAAPRTTGTRKRRSYAIGVGGDDAEPIVIDCDRPVCVVGEPTREREAVVASIAASTRVAGASSAVVTTADTPFAVTAAQRESAAIVIARPSSATVREFAGDAAPGLVDDRHVSLRVALLVGGVGYAVQLYAASASSSASAD